MKTQVNAGVLDTSPNCPFTGATLQVAPDWFAA